MGLFQKNLDIKARLLDRPADFSQLFPCSVRYLFLDGIEGGVDSLWRIPWLWADCTASAIC